MKTSIALVADVVRAIHLNQPKLAFALLSQMLSIVKEAAEQHEKSLRDRLRKAAKGSLN